MKKNLAAVFIVCLLLGIGILYRPDVADAGVGNSPGAQKIKPQTNALQLPFIANKGQIDSKVKYYARTFNGSFFVTQDGELVYSFAKPQSTDTLKAGAQYSVLREKFIGNTKEPSFRGEGEGTKVSIYKGNEPARWKKNISSYELISMGGVYQGIELKLRAYGDTIEKIFLVKPGADPKTIRSRLEGAKNIQVNDKGELEIQTDIGTAVFSKPVAYQTIGQGDKDKGQKEYVQVAYSAEGNQYSFIVGDYDKTRELVIDPYVGVKIQGSAEDRAYAILPYFDGDVHRIFVAGYSYSQNFPSNYAFGTSGTSDSDVFVAKLSEDLGTVEQLVFIAGTGDDFGYSLEMDSAENIYVAGTTTSSDLPIPIDYLPADDAYSGGTDVFVAKLSYDLTSLIALTYLGGDSLDAVNADSLAINGNDIVVAGYTQGGGTIPFPTPDPFAYETVHNGSDDIFIAIFNTGLEGSPIPAPGLEILRSTTFIGGSGSERPYAMAIRTGYSEVYVAGYTSSSNYPFTAGAYDTSYNFGANDAFISRIMPAISPNPSLLGVLASSTFLGGSVTGTVDEIHGIALDIPGGYAYVTGNTNSPDFPGSCIQGVCGGMDVFVARFGDTLTGTPAPIFIKLGGTSSDYGKSLILNGGMVFVSGVTYSNDFPTNAFDTTFGGTHGVHSDGFVLRYDSSLLNFDASTYLGGSTDDFAPALASDTAGNIYVAGSTNSTDFPTTLTSYGGSSGSFEAYVAKFDDMLQGVPCIYTMSPEGNTFPAAGGSFSFSITTSAGCTWNASTEDSWITTSSSGSGSGAVNFTVSSNADRVRQGMIAVEGKYFIVTQNGPGLSLTDPSTGQQYQRFDELLDRNGAQSRCQSLGGHLATITSSLEQSFVYGNLVSGGTNGMHDCWIGAYQIPCIPEPGCGWQWLSGETWGYDNWGTFEPNNAFVNENSIVLLTYDGTWNDFPETSLQSFVCEWTEQDHELIVSKTGSGHGTVRSSEYPSPYINCCSGQCEAVCSAFYSPDTQVILNAVPDADSIFLGWSGACTGAGSCHVTMNNDKDVTAVFNLRQYAVSTQTNEGGGILPASATVSHGDSTQFSISVDTGYQVSSATGCGGSLDGFYYYTGPITADCTVTVNFVSNTHIVSTEVIPQAGGSVSPASATVNHDATRQFTVTTAPGYHIVSVTGCGGSLSGDTYTTGHITSDCMVSASFAINTYTVTASAGAGGGISPSGAITVNHGATPAFTVTPNAGYHIAGVNGTCGGSLNGSTYTTNSITGNCTVQASFAINTHTVTASAGAGGSISPSGATTVNHGATPAFTVTPNAGYHIAGVNGTCGGSLNGNTYTTNSITGNCTVQASFAINEYTVSALAGPGGGISPTAVTVQHGETAQFTITPDAGYHLLSAGGCGETLSQGSLKAAAKKKKKGKVKALAATMYTTGPITGACTVNATFEINAYTVTAEAGEGGSISPSNATVPHGNTAQFTVAPSTGYHVKAVTGCGGSLDEGIYTTGAVTESCTVSASFEINEYTVSTAAGQGGGIAPASAQVTHGNTAQFAITPDAGYHILSVSGCEGAVVERSLKAAAKKKKKNKRTQALTGSTYTTGPITGACTVTATFEIDAYTVTADAGPGGNIDPSGVTTVNYGATPAFTVTPNQGYHIASMSGTCGGSLSGSTYTTNSVTESCTVHAEFEINEYTVSTSAGQGGGIAPVSAKVNHGETTHFTVTPDTNYHIVSATGCGGILNGNTYTTGQITENCTVTASFAVNTYAVTILKSGNGNGAILAQGLACEDNACSGEYAHGTKVIFKVEPEAGFRVADVRIDGVSIGAMNTFTFKKLTGNHAIEIIFAPL